MWIINVSLILETFYWILQSSIQFGETCKFLVERLYWRVQGGIDEMEWKYDEQQGKISEGKGIDDLSRIITWSTVRADGDTS